jgi:hypothetical protein
MKKIILAAVLGLSVQTVFAEVQVKSTISYLSGGDLSVFAPVTGEEQLIGMDDTNPNYVDWNDPGHEFATECGMYPIVNGAVIDAGTANGKHALAAALSANATGREVILMYHTEVDVAWQSGFKCVVDAVIMAGLPPPSP